MNFESRFSPTVSIEDNEQIRDVSNSSESKIHTNGSFDLQNTDYNELLDEKEEASSVPWESKSQVRKGYGLKKWRRIRRDVSKIGESSVDTVKIVTEELPNSSLNPSKRAQVYAERDQKSEGSNSISSSRIPVIGNLGVFPLFGDHSSPSVDLGTDLENSENGSSKSSTAASVPIVKYGMGFPHDNKYIMNGNNLSQNTHIKKTKGEQIKPEKEASDSHSSYANGIASEGAVDHGENGDEVQSGRENGGGYQEISTQDVVADLSKEKIENNDSPLDQDPLVESIYELQTAQEALEKELLKIKEIGKDLSVDDSDLDTQPEITESADQFTSGDAHNFSWAVHPQMVEIAKRDAEREIEELLRQRNEAEVEYLAISTIQKLKVPAVDQITGLEHKATMLKKEAEKLENRCEEIASSDEALKLQKKVCKYTLYFLVQISSLLVIFGVVMFQMSPNYVELVPT